MSPKSLPATIRNDDGERVRFRDLSPHVENKVDNYNYVITELSVVECHRKPAGDAG